MTHFDKDEQRIHDAFSNIEVDANRFKENMHALQPVGQRPRLKFSKLAAAMVMVIVMSATTYATMVRFEFIHPIFDSPLTEYALPQVEPVYAVDEGIRIEVIAAEQIDDTILLYLTVQDVSGEGLFEPYRWDPTVHGPLMTQRIEQVGEDQFRSWSVSSPYPFDAEAFNFSSVGVSPWFDLYIGDERYIHGFGGMGQLVYFNKETQTFYLEMILFSDEKLPNMNALELRMDSIAISFLYEPIEEIAPDIHLNFIPLASYERTVRGEWHLPVNVSDIEHPVILWEDVVVSLAENEYHFEYIRLHPFGIRGTSTQHLGSLFMRTYPDWFNIEIELANGESIIAGPGGGGERFSWMTTNEPIDIEAVTAIIINGYRLEVPR
ncbi:MAG: hypothetical protein FWE07_02105 [Turicibacter sp.]|nr:hypothetical protein [Turicibacter sp.]